MVYTATWGIIWYLPPIKKGTRFHSIEGNARFLFATFVETTGDGCGQVSPDISSLVEEFCRRIACPWARRMVREMGSQKFQGNLGWWNIIPFGQHSYFNFKNYQVIINIHTRKQTWNLEIPPWKRRNIYKPPSFGFHVCFGGCTD